MGACALGEALLALHRVRRQRTICSSLAPPRARLEFARSGHTPRARLLRRRRISKCLSRRLASARQPQRKTSSDAARRLPAAAAPVRARPDSMFSTSAVIRRRATQTAPSARPPRHIRREHMLVCQGAQKQASTHRACPHHALLFSVSVAERAHRGALRGMMLR